MGTKEFIKSTALQLGAMIYNDNSSKVIYYHDVHKQKRHTPMSTRLDLFKEHIDIVKRCGYTFVSEISKKENEIEITFDDGFRGLYENFGFFVENSIAVHLFVVSDFIGKKEYLSEKEIAELIDTGFLKVGSHTKTHRNLDTLNQKEVAKELEESKKRLEDIAGMYVDSFCFPRGRFSDAALEEAKKAGYKKLYSCLPGPYFQEFKPTLLNRSLVQHASANEFRAILRGGDRLFFNRFKKMHYHPGDGS